MPDLTYHPGNVESARARVATPAVAIMVIAGVSIGVALLSLLINILGIGVGAFGRLRDDQRIAQFLTGGLGLAFNLVALVINPIAIWGALRMKALRSYGLSVTAAVIVMIPCTSCCCLFGLPIGIWALVVLMSEEVKAAFT